MRRYSLVFAVGLTVLSLQTTAVYAQGNAVSATALPVREVTVFKDGHAFVVRQGKAPVENGAVTVTDLPVPVMGTFWPYSAESNAPLHSVVARRRAVKGDRPALSLREMIEANIGARVRITEFGDKTVPYEATIIAAPERDEPSEEDMPTPPNARIGPAPSGTLILLKTDAGTKALDINRIQDVTFLGDSKQRLAQNDYRGELSLNLTGAGKNAEVGMMYLQKGLRWIPSYKVTLDGKAAARIQLQATLVNDLIDLNNVTMNLVIGVPTFAFKDTPDPVSLQDTFAQLSRYFQADSNTAFGLSNAITSQGAFAYNARLAEPAPSTPEVTGGGTEEDLFVFTVKNITLAKKQRLVVPIADFTLPYKDVYTLELPPVLPRDLRSQYGGSIPGEEELAKLLAQPRVQHQVRFTNTSPYPLTTAPALVLSGQRVIAQGMMTYASKGATTDLSLTGAVDIAVKRSDKEKERIPNAIVLDRTQFTQVNLTGAIEVTNYRTEPAIVEVTRYVYGTITSANEKGEIEALDAQMDPTFGIGSSSTRYVVPGDLSRYNGLGRVLWKGTILPGKCLELQYDWRYLLR